MCPPTLQLKVFVNELSVSFPPRSTRNKTKTGLVSLVFLKIEPLALARALISLSHTQLALVRFRRHAINTFPPCKSESRRRQERFYYVYYFSGLFRTFSFSFCLRFFVLISGRPILH